VPPAFLPAYAYQVWIKRGPVVARRGAAGASSRSELAGTAALRAPAPLAARRAAADKGKPARAAVAPSAEHLLPLREHVHAFFLGLCRGGWGGGRYQGIVLGLALAEPQENSWRAISPVDFAGPQISRLCAQRHGLLTDGRKGINESGREQGRRASQNPIRARPLCRLLGTR
jgi:hypothetical protein